MSVTEADGTISRECDTFTCAHGNEIVRVLPGISPGTICHACMGRICDACAAELMKTLRCMPFEQKLEVAEHRAKFRRAIDAADQDLLLRRSFPNARY
jgi:hypothetical protein